jgi:hypothetical protein
MALAASCSSAARPAPGGETPKAVPHHERRDAIEALEACERPTLVGTVTASRVEAREGPGAGSDVVGVFPRVNDQGAVQVFPLLDRLETSGSTWYRAMLPMRPNGSTGWVPGDDLRIGQTGYRIAIDLRRFRLQVLDRCDVVARFAIGVGTNDTPTPRGAFFLNSLLQPPDRGSVYGAFAFGLSAYSDVITDWEGGGIVGLHGTNDPSSIGRNASHGCIRMTNDAIRFLARTVPLGTPVEIS